MKKLIVLVFAIIFFVGKANAQRKTGEQLQTECKQSTKGDDSIPVLNWQRLGFCTGYIEGVVDSQVVAKSPFLSFCV